MSPTLHMQSRRISGSFLPASTPATGARNPLNLKVNRILSANYEESGTRRALDTLGDFERDELSGTNIAAVFGGEGDGARKKPNYQQGRMGMALQQGGLRKEVESRMAEGSRSFLAAFSEVNDVSAAVPPSSSPSPSPSVPPSGIEGCNVGKM